MIGKTYGNSLETSSGSGQQLELFSAWALPHLSGEAKAYLLKLPTPPPPQTKAWNVEQHLEAGLCRSGLFFFGFQPLKYYF